MVGTMERRMNAWIDRNLNGYTAGLGTAVGLIVGGYVAFGVLDIHLLPRIRYHAPRGGSRRVGGGGDCDPVYAGPGQADAAVASRDASG